MMLQNWRVLLLLIIVLGAVMSIGFRYYPYGRYGVEITYVDEQSPASGVLEQGMQITQVNGQNIKNVDDWDKAVQGINGETNIVANGMEHYILVEGPLGISVQDLERTNLNLGLDIRGGTRIILEPQYECPEDNPECGAEIVNEIITTLETRSNVYGLREIKFFPVRGAAGDYYIQVEATGVGSDLVEELLSRQGKFEAKVIKYVQLQYDNSTGSGTMELGANEYSVETFGDGVTVDGTFHNENETFSLESIDFEFHNVTGGEAVFYATVYEGDDIELVYTDAQHSAVIDRGGYAEFYFGVLVSEEGAQRFAKVTEGMTSYVDVNSGERYLNSKILLYLDGKLVSDLRIGASLAGQAYTTPQISGGKDTMEEAVDEKVKLQTILRSGALPTELKTESVDVISPTLGEGFMSSAIIAAGLAALAVLVVIFIRYRSPKFAFPLVLIGLSEVVIILGISASNDEAIWGMVLLANFVLITTSWWKKHEVDIFAWGGALLIPILGMMSWTIDLPAIGGIIAAIGTGVDHQIIITDETRSGKREDYDFRQKIKMAFFIIFGAAFTTIFAIIPMTLIGIGLVRGFAITTIVGVLVGILVTRPAYAKIVEILTQKGSS